MILEVNGARAGRVTHQMLLHGPMVSVQVLNKFESSPKSSCHMLDDGILIFNIILLI